MFTGAQKVVFGIVEITSWIIEPLWRIYLWNILFACGLLLSVFIIRHRRHIFIFQNWKKILSFWENCRIMLEPVPAQPLPLRNIDLSIVVLLNKYENNYINKSTPYAISFDNDKKEEIWPSPMIKAHIPTEMSKGQSDNTNNATKKFD